ncbi:hypothetical protein ACQ9LF_07270 [Anaerohalosphaeraceae bacterium U12dextr]
MKKAGLQKKIAFIFDGQESLAQSQSATGACSTPKDCSPISSPTPVPEPSAPFYTKTGTAGDKPAHGSTESAVLPQRPTTRPQPVPKNNTGGTNIITLRKAIAILKNHLTGSATGKAMAHQRKMGMLVAVLTLVFVGVLYAVLGSGPSIANALTQDTDTGQNITAASPKKWSESWPTPPLFSPSERDPMKFSGKITSGGAVIQGSLSVRGIVYSPQKPSAIISGQVLFEGDSIGDIRICKIQKDSVEFEKHGKRWKQQVEQHITESQ